MRPSSSLGFALVGLALLLACSKSDPPPPQVTPPPTGDDSGTPEASASSSTSSSSSSGDPLPKEWVKTTTENVQHQGSARRYILSVPLDYDANKKYPLYIWLHGNPGTAENAASFKVHNVTKNEAIIAYPGSIDTGGWDHSASVRDNVDSTFILAMLDAVVAKYSIDTSRVLISGWSGGGFMSSAMACRFSGRFRAIGIHAGGAPYDVNDPNGTPACRNASIATLVTHGRNDGTVGFDSGTYAAQYWSEHNSCSGGKSAGTPAPCEDYSGCATGKPVRSCFISGLGHPLWDQALTVEWDWFKALP